MVAAPEIFCCPLAAVDAALLDRYRTLLSDGELQRLAGYRSPIAAQEFLIGRALLRTTLARLLDCEPAALRFDRGDDGKPFLTAPAANALHFNLSHCSQWVGLIVGSAGAVGIDIEVHARRNNIAGIAQRFYSAAENALLQRAPAAQWSEYFFAIWTAKEAHAKARGCGLAKILSCSSIEPDLDNATMAFDLRDIARCDTRMAAWSYRLDENITLAASAMNARANTLPSIFRVVPLRETQPLSLRPQARGEWRP